MRFATYATFENLHGRKSTIAELIVLLQNYSRESVLYLCSVIGTSLRLWEGEPDPTHYDLVMRAVFEFLRADWYSLSYRRGRNDVVIHRRQLLLIMKLAVQHCPEHGLDVLQDRPGRFGTICLMANDQFHYNLLASASKGKLVDRDKIARVLNEFVSVSEYGGPRGEKRIVRSHLMATHFSKLLQSDKDFVDLAKEFELQTGMTLEAYEALAFGLYTRCGLVDLATIQKNAWAAAVNEFDFYTTAFSRDAIRAFLAELTVSSSQATERIRSRDFGPNDFTVFRDKPLLKEAYGLLPTDILFLLEKFESGPYWRVNSISREKGDRLRRFWGRVFESYVNAQIAESAGQSADLFVPDPRPIDDRSIQICDGLLLKDNSLVVLEYKSCMFSAEAKYSGNHEQLLGQIARNLVRDEREKKKKGVEQLAEAIKQLFDPTKPVSIQGLDASRVATIYPLLVTLDDLGGSLLMSMLLNTWFEKLLDRRHFPQVTLKPVFCVDVETLELILPYHDVMPLHRFLQYWLDADDKLMATLQAYLPGGLPPRRNEMIFRAWQAIGKRIENQLFPS